MLLTLTLDSYGRVRDDGTPVNPATYDYRRAAWDAVHFPALLDRFWQNLRRCVGWNVQYFGASNPNGAWPRTRTSPSGAPFPAPCSNRCSPRPTTRCGGRPPT